MSDLRDELGQLIDALEHDETGAIDLGHADDDSESEETAVADASQPEGSETDTNPEDDGPVDELELLEEGADRRVGFYLTPRQTFNILAGVLAVLLVGLIAYLLWLSRPADFTREGGASRAGLIPVLAMYGPGKGENPTFKQPMGSAFSPDGRRMYVADTINNRIVVFDKNGKYKSEFGGFGIAKPLEGAAMTWDPGELNYPTDVAVDGRGNVYVADFYNDSVSVFTSKGKFIRRFPDPYKITGKGSSGHDGTGIAVTALTVADGKVYATDEYQVFVFSAKGELLRQFGMPGLGPTGLDRPGGIAVDSRGRIYVSDSNHNRVVAFSPVGKPLWVTGAPVKGLMKETDNPFILPRGLTVLRDGSILVADPLGQQLVKLDENGKVVANYGERGTVEGQLNFPNDVASFKDKILVADRENNRVQVVRLSDR